MLQWDESALCGGDGQLAFAGLGAEEPGQGLQVVLSFCQQVTMTQPGPRHGFGQGGGGGWMGELKKKKCMGAQIIVSEKVDIQVPS